MNLASRKRQWPLGRGFERFYGFLGGETNQWYPDLVYDNHPVEPPALARGGLPPDRRPHRQGDRVHPRRQGDRARTSRSSSTSAPAPRTRRTTCRRSGPTSTRASSTWATRRTASRCSSVRRQMGIVPESTELSPINPYVDDDEPRRQAVARARHGPAVGLAAEDEKRLFCRMAEVYAGFLSHADHQIGRLLDYLEETGQLDNTIIVVVSDNGASGEGGPERLGQREQVLQRRARHDRGEPEAPRRAGLPEHLQPLPDGLGVGVQHAVQDVEALRELRGRHRRPADRLLAARASRPGARSATSTPTPSTSCPRSTRRSASSCRTRSTATRSSRSRASASPRPSTTPSADTGRRRSSTRCSARGRSGTRAGRRRRPCPRRPTPGATSRSQRWELFNTDHRPQRVPRPRRAGARAPAGADRHVVGRGRQVPGAAARDAQRDRDPDNAAPRALQAAHPVRLPPGRRGDPRVRRRRTSAAAPTRSPPRSTSTRPDADGILFSQGSRFGGHALYIKDGKLGLRLQLRRRARPGGRVDGGGARPGHVVLSASFEREGDEMPAAGTLSLHIRDQKVGEQHDPDPAGQVRARRRRAGGRPLGRRAGRRRLSGRARPGRSSAEPSSAC